MQSAQLHSVELRRGTCVRPFNGALSWCCGPVQSANARAAALDARRERRAPPAEQGTTKADPKAVSAYGVGAAMAADYSRPLDMLMIASRLEAGAADGVRRPSIEKCLCVKIEGTHYIICRGYSSRNLKVSADSAHFLTRVVHLQCQLSCLPGTVSAAVMPLASALPGLQMRPYCCFS